MRSSAATHTHVPPTRQQTGIAPAAADPLDAVRHHLLSRLVTSFFLGTRLVRLGPSDGAVDDRVTNIGKYLMLTHAGVRYGLEHERLFSVLETQLMESISHTLSRHLTALVVSGPPDDVGQSLEDCCVADFLTDDSSLAETLVRVLQVVRRCSVSTYENHRVTTGALVQVGHNPCEPRWTATSDAVSYSIPLTQFKTFHRLCDGRQTIALVDSRGLLVGINDVNDCCDDRSRPLPFPVARAYEPLARATLEGWGIAVVLADDGTIRVFANGVQLLTFAAGRWMLSDLADKLAALEAHIGSRVLSWRLMATALNFSARRHGAMFVVLDDAAPNEAILSAGDRLDNLDVVDDTSGSRRRFHYLWRHANALTMAPSTLEGIADLDGAVVMRRGGQLVAIGAILRSADSVGDAEGARTTAAVGAAQVGTVVKVSEDGGVSVYARGPDLGGGVKTRTVQTLRTALFWVLWSAKNVAARKSPLISMSCRNGLSRRGASAA